MNDSNMHRLKHADHPATDEELSALMIAMRHALEGIENARDIVMNTRPSGEHVQAMTALADAQRLIERVLSPRS